MYRKLGMGFVLLLVICTLNAVQPAEAAKPRAKFDKAACEFKIPEGQTVQCGWLTVPEKHSGAKDNNTFRLHVGIFKAKTPKGGPVVYLEGGPGGHALQAVAELRPNGFSFVNQEHDLVIFDQRGTGYSEPSLDCPEVLQYQYGSLDSDKLAYSRTLESSAALLKCHNRLVKAGVDLTAFSTTEDAADVEDLRIALGYAKWDLYGISYGTRLALEVMRDFPKGVRSVVLDSSLAELNGFPDQSTRLAFDVLFKGCASNQLCNYFYPNLQGIYRDLIIHLNTHPAMVTVKHPITGKSYDMLIRGSDVTSALFSALYSTTTIPKLPSILAEADAGHYDALAALVFRARIVGQEYVSLGMNLLVNCTDRALSSISCKQFGAGTPRPAGTGIVKSSLPVLVMEGRYDPITPPRYSKKVVETLTNSFYFEFPGIGHGVSVSHPCPARIMLDFLTAPTKKPNSACIAQMKEPDFVVRAEL